MINTVIPLYNNGTDRPSETWCVNISQVATEQTEKFKGSLTMVNGINLQAIQFKEPSLDGNIADKVECLHCPYSTDSILFFWQMPWLWPVKTVNIHIVKEERL